MSKIKSSKEPILKDTPLKNTVYPTINSQRIYFSIILICSLLLYGNTAFNLYALDDQLTIYDNKFVTEGVSGIPDILTHDAFEGFFGERGSKLISGGRYRPLSFVTFAIEWELFQNNPMISHCINIVLYGLMCCAMYYFLILLFNDFNHIKFNLSLSLLATLLYCFHPIHTEVVANIKGRDEILAFLFALCSFIVFIKLLEKDSLNKKIILFILMAMAMLSKENSITFLAIFPLIAFYKDNFNLKKQFMLYIPVVLAAIFYLILRFKFTQVGVSDLSTEILNNPFARAVGTEKFGTTVFSYLQYLWILVFPFNLTHDYYFNQIPYRDLQSPLVWVAILFVLGIIFYLIKNYKSKSIVFFGILFFVVTFSIVSNAFFTVGIIMNERFVFISSMGFSLIIAFYLLKIKNSKILYLFIFGILGFYSFKTIDRNRAWYDNYTLFSTDYKTSQNSAKVSTALGGTYTDLAEATKDTTLRRKRLDSSIDILNNSINIYPENSQAWLLLGNAFIKRFNDNQKGLEIYKKALSLRPIGYFDGNFNIAIIYYNMNEKDSALKYIKMAHEINPEHPETKTIYSKLLAQKGLTNEAVQIAGNTSVENISDLANTARLAGNIPEAMNLVEKALASNPNDPLANYVKGICLARHLNRLQDGIPYIEKAVNSKTNNPAWLEDLAVAYGFTGQIAKTIPLFEEVIRLRPDNPNGYFNLAASYAKINNKSKAEYYNNLGLQKKATP